MTKNQVDLRDVKVKEAALEEEKRHNLATEGMTQEHYERSDAAATMQAQASVSQAETARMRIPIDWMNAQTSRMSVEELARHNQTVEVETQRHDETMERYTKADLDQRFRHNVALENQGWAEISVAERQAAVREREAAVKEKQYQTDKEHWESEFAFNNVKYISEGIRQGVELSQNSRRLDIEEYKAKHPAKNGDINIYDNDNNAPGYATPHVHTGGGSPRGDEDDGFLETVGSGADTIIKAVGETGAAVINFLTGGK